LATVACKGAGSRDNVLGEGWVIDANLDAGVGRAVDAGNAVGGWACVSAAGDVDLCAGHLGWSSAVCNIDKGDGVQHT